MQEHSNKNDGGFMAHYSRDYVAKYYKFYRRRGFLR